MPAMKNRSRGVTLVELMTALSVLAVLVAIAVPSFRTFSVESRITATANDLATALNLARSEALRSSAPGVVCASANGTTCSGSTNWATGWIAFADANGDGAPAAAEIRQVWPAVTAPVTVTAGGSSVTWNLMGMKSTAGAFEFQIASTGCVVSRRVVTQVIPTGSVSTHREIC